MLSDIVSMYARLVEQYDRLEDPIKLYFLEKMQMLLTQKELFIGKDVDFIVIRYLLGRKPT